MAARSTYKSETERVEIFSALVRRIQPSNMNFSYAYIVLAALTALAAVITEAAPVPEEGKASSYTFHTRSDRYRTLSNAISYQ